MRERLTVLNAFVHDVATGTWISSLAVFALVRKNMTAPGWRPHLAALAPELAELRRALLALTWASLAVIAATGVVRMITFKVFGWTGDVARDRVRLLKVKHALLGIVFAAGTIWQLTVTLG